MGSPAEIVSGGSGKRDGPGVVVALRNEPPTTPKMLQPQSPLSELGPLSPELALVDPELARAARERLPDLPRAIPVGTHAVVAPATEHSAFVERLRSGIDPVPDVPRPRRRVRLVRLSLLAGLIALGVLLTALVGREWGSAPRQQTGLSATTAAGASKTPATAASRHEPTTPGQTFVWAVAPEAAAYEFQLFQGGERIFRVRVDEPRLELPGHWRQGGRPHALVPGSYRWYVWAVPKGAKRPSTVAIVQAKLVIEKQPQ